MPINRIPSTPFISDEKGRLTPLYEALMSSIDYWLSPVGSSGATANRPLGSTARPLYVGQPYFDTSLGKPIWVKSMNPTVWVDATGASI